MLLLKCLQRRIQGEFVAGGEDVQHDGENLPNFREEGERLLFRRKAVPPVFRRKLEGCAGVFGGASRDHSRDVDDIAFHKRRVVLNIHIRKHLQ